MQQEYQEAPSPVTTLKESLTSGVLRSPAWVCTGVQSPAVAHAERSRGRAPACGDLSCLLGIPASTAEAGSGRRGCWGASSRPPSFTWLAPEQPIVSFLDCLSVALAAASKPSSPRATPLSEAVMEPSGLQSFSGPRLTSVKTVNVCFSHSELSILQPSTACRMRTKNGFGEEGRYLQNDRNPSKQTGFSISQKSTFHVFKSWSHQ